MNLPRRVLVTAMFCASTVNADEFRIVGAEFDTLGRLQVSYPAESNTYYLLLRSDVLDGPSVPATLQEAVGEMTDPTPATARTAAFYRVQSVPIAWPLDTDRDGIDDVWELRQPALNPLLASDAQQPSAGPGSQTWKQVYDTAVATGVLPFASFAVASATNLVTDGTAQVRLRFSRVYSRPVFFQVGGTALAGQDYEITGLNMQTLTGTVNGSGTETIIPIALKDRPTIDLDRTLVLSLLQPEAATQVYRLATNAPVTHTVLLREGDHGVYFGSLSVTNGFVLGAQPLRVALRSGGSSGMAFFDTSQSSFFKAPFEVPVQFGPDGTPLEFLGGAAGIVESATLQRRLNWNLQFAPVIPGTNNNLSARFILELSGLTASGRTFIAEGLLQLNRADN